MMAAIGAGTRIDGYAVEAALPGSRGGFAQVLAAASDGASQLVALKVARVDAEGDAHPEACARALSNEVDALRNLKHPGIVRIYPIPIDERRVSYMARASELPGAPWYFVMEYLAGGTVEELLRQRRIFPPALAVELAHQVAAALDYIHAKGYAHLDVKTNNIMLRRLLSEDELPEAVLIDFGAAQKTLRRAEVEAGALMYLPPERVQVLIGEKAPETVTNKPAADVYGLGMTLYRMLTGDLPFHGQREHVTTAILTAPPTQPMKLNHDLVALPDLDALIMQMLAKDPEDRPCARDVLARLDAAVRPPRMASALSALAAPARAARSWKRVAFLLTAVVLIEAAGLAYLGAARRAEPAATLVTPASVVESLTVAPALTSTTTPVQAPASAATAAPTPGL